MARNHKKVIAFSGERVEEINRDLRNALRGKDDEPIDMMQIHRAAKVITCISNGVNTLSEIADFCQLSKSTVHRLLKALEKSSFIMYNAFNRQYLIGTLITDIAASPETYHDYLKICAGKEMEELAAITEETVMMNVMVGLRQVRVMAILSKHDLRVVEGSRQAAYIFGGAGSQVLLAQLKDDELKTALKHLKLEKLTGLTVSNNETLLARIQKIRKQGYAITCGERMPGAIGVAAPVRNYVLPVALLIIGPECRMKDKTANIVDLLLTIADRISFNLIDIFKPNI
jgi:IclR family transcriptional regulator, KDG regulon repressor